MASYSNLVHETTTGTGTGNLTLVSVVGKQSFNDAFGTGGADVFWYFISSTDAAEWEAGTGHLSAADTLVRDTVIDSSNAGAVVNFSAGTKNVTNDIAAESQFSGNLGAVDNVLLRANGVGGQTIQGSPAVCADTTGALSRNGGGGLPLQGTNTNDSAASGFVGEYISSVVPSTSAVSLTSPNAEAVTSVTLTAGDWDVAAEIAFDPGATTSFTAAIGSISTSSNAVSGFGVGSAGSQVALRSSGSVPGNDFGFPVPTTRVTVASSAVSDVIYLVALAVFTVSTMGAYGYIRARRAR